MAVPLCPLRALPFRRVSSRRLGLRSALRGLIFFLLDGRLRLLRVRSAVSAYGAPCQLIRHCDRRVDAPYPNIATLLSP